MSEKTLAAVCGGRNERAGGTSLAERRVAIDGETVRTWRMREDPFADVWQSEVVPQLVADTEGRLQVLTLLTALCRRHPGHFQPGQLRTLQRRVRDWRVQFWLRPDCDRLERQLPGGIRTRWETAPCHGALNKLAIGHVWRSVRRPPPWDSRLCCQWNSESSHQALRRMRDAQLRRLPVVNVTASARTVMTRRNDRDPHVVNEIG